MRIAINRAKRRLMQSRFRRLLKTVRQFRSDEKGSITIQMIIFSLLLLGSTGLVLDSGRVFTQHSQIQAFSDQMALAAASELDGQPDSIRRAAQAVFGKDGNNQVYLRKAMPNYGEFGVVSIGFFQVMLESDKPQSDMTGAFPSSNMLARATYSTQSGQIQYEFAGGDVNEGDMSRLALYAVVQGSKGQVRSVVQSFADQLLTMGNDPKEGYNDTKNTNLNSFGEVIEFGAVSAASLTEITCAEMSTLVFCNPWENISPSPLDTDPNDALYSVPGRTLMYFAPNFPDPTSRGPVLTGTESYFDSFYPWDVNHQIFNLHSPVADESGVCDQLTDLRFSGEDYLVARERCLMAKAQQDQVCWGTEQDLEIIPAHGPSVVRSLNTIFDIWSEPFATVIEDSGQTLSADDPLSSENMRMHDLFEPDLVAVTMYEPGDWHGGTPGTVQDGSVAEEIEAAGSTLFDMGAAYATPSRDLVLKEAYRQTYMMDSCHLSTYDALASGTPPASAEAGRCEHDFIGDHFQGATGGTYPQTQITSYWEDTYLVNPAAVTNPLFPGYAQFCGAQALYDVLPGFEDYCETATITDPDIDTWYEVYQRERMTFLDVVTNPEPSRVTDASTGGLWCATDAAEGEEGYCGGIDYVTRYGLTNAFEAFVKQGPADFYAMTGESALFNPGRERRRIRAAMVNCGTITGRQPSAEGTYSVLSNELRIMDMYLPGPAGAHCGLEPFDPADPKSAEERVILECPLDEYDLLDGEPSGTQVSKETHLFVEIIEDASHEITQQYTAHLVR